MVSRPNRQPSTTKGEGRDADGGMANYRNWRQYSGTCCRQLGNRSPSPGDHILRHRGNLLEEIRVPEGHHDHVVMAASDVRHPVRERLWRVGGQRVPALPDIRRDDRQVGRIGERGEPRIVGRRIVRVDELGMERRSAAPQLGVERRASGEISAMGNRDREYLWRTGNRGEWQADAANRAPPVIERSAIVRARATLALSPTTARS